MKRIILALMAMIVYCGSLSAQSNWKIGHFKDQFGDPDMSTVYLENTGIRNSYSYLDVISTIDDRKREVIMISLHDKSDGEKKNIYSPAKITLKHTPTGRVSTFTAEMVNNGTAFFFGKDAVEMSYFLDAGNIKVSFEVSQYNTIKNHVYTVNQQTTGYYNTIKQFSRR